MQLQPLNYEISYIKDSSSPEYYLKLKDYTEYYEIINNNSKSDYGDYFATIIDADTFN